MNETIDVWDLKRGERFKLPAGYNMPNDVFVFDHMDGMYCFAKRESDGQVLNWRGPVERVP